jgi:hypothetical protein
MRSDQWRRHFTVALVVTKTAIWLNKYELWKRNGRAWPGLGQTIDQALSSGQPFEPLAGVDGAGAIPQQTLRIPPSTAQWKWRLALSAEPKR